MLQTGIQRRGSQRREDPGPGAQRVVRDVEPQHGKQAVPLIARAENSLRDVASTARLRARQYFLPGAKLLRNRLLLLDRTRPEARENLLACELKLPPRVAGLILGREALAGAAPYSSLVEPDITLEQVILPARSPPE